MTRQTKKSASRRPDLRWDQRGTLVEGLFYRVSIWDAFFYDTMSEREREKWLVLNSSRGDKERMAYIDEYGAHCSPSKEFLCENGRDHRTIEIYDNPDGERFNGDKYQEFIRDTCLNQLFVRASFANRIQSTNLRGWRFGHVKARNHFTGKQIRGVQNLQCIGNNCVRPMIINPRKNKCPFCGEHWVVCTKCGYIANHCLKCNERTLRGADYDRVKNRRRLTIEEGSWDDDILEGHRWNGADFVGVRANNYSSKRTIDWLLGIHAGPLAATPVRFCVDGMNARQRKWVKEVADVTTIIETSA